jgi:hypothetical protein
VRRDEKRKLFFFTLARIFAEGCVLDLTALSWQELTRLRNVVRRVHMRYYPTSHLNWWEADRIIETIGEETAQRLLKQLVDGHLADGKLAK